MAMQQPREMIKGEPVGLICHFYMPRPKSVTVAQRAQPHVMPDLDKLVRAVGDSLSGIMYKDDALITVLQACKEYADDKHPAGVRIYVYEAGYDNDRPQDGCKRDRDPNVLY